MTTSPRTVSSVPLPLEPSHNVMSLRSTMSTTVPISSTIPVNIPKAVCDDDSPAVVATNVAAGDDRSDGGAKAWVDTDSKKTARAENDLAIVFVVFLWSSLL